MSDIYIEDFNHDVAMILHRLYSSFPRPAALYIDEIAGLDDPDDYGVASERHQRCLGAMIWLAEEDFIRYRDLIGIEGVDAAVLTLKTFRALHKSEGHQSEEHDPQTMLINTLRDALRERNSEAVKRCVNTLFNVFG